MTRPAAAPLARTLPLYLLIAALPFCDFLQTGLVAFNAAPVMGDIGASPEEYSVVATLYGGGRHRHDRDAPLAGRAPGLAPAAAGGERAVRARCAGLRIRPAACCNSDSGAP